jgi:hypothetical protein
MLPMNDQSNMMSCEYASTFSDMSGHIHHSPVPVSLIYLDINSVSRSFDHALYLVKEYVSMAECCFFNYWLLTEVIHLRWCVNFIFMR